MTSKNRNKKDSAETSRSRANQEHDKSSQLPRPDNARGDVGSERKNENRNQ